MNDFGYLSDEALLSLMEFSEEQGLLSAPRDLKPAILEEAARQSVSRSRPSRKRQFADYCVRVGLATAASLVLVFAGGRSVNHLSQPAQNAPSLSTAQQFNQFTDKLEEGYQSINQKLSQFVLNFDFGGNRHE